MALEESDRVTDGYGCARRGDGSGFGLGDGNRAGAQPAAFDQAYDGAGVLGQDGRTALAEVYWVTEEEDFGGRGGLIELGGFVREDFAGEAVFAGDFESVSALLPRRVKRKGEDGLAGCGRLGGEWQKSDFVLGGERIGDSAEDGNVMLGVCGDDRGLEQNRRAISAAD